MLGESTRGRHIHSTAPDGATSATVSQSDRNAYSAMGGNALVPVRGSYSRSRMGADGAGAGAGRGFSSGLLTSSRKVGSIERTPQNAKFWSRSLSGAGGPEAPRRAVDGQPPRPPSSVNGLNGRWS